MFGQAKLLVKFMDGSDTRFIIPVYQRNYDWKIENCRQLYDDLVKVIKQERERHFFGSVVSVANSYGATSELLIIDGQQRITTISLLMLAMVNLIKEGKVDSNDAILCSRIEESYLIDKYQPEEKKVKLKPIKDDQDAFLKLFDDKYEYNKFSNVTRNYQYFYERIQKNEISIDELFTAIKALEIIDISLDPTKDDAQLIFESLNSTGLDLSEGDKIRNFILMGLENNLQEKYYYDYWNKIEKETNYEVSEYIRHYLTLKTGKIPNKSDVYGVFKFYVEHNKIDTKNLLEDVLKLARYYNELNSASTGIKKVDAILKRLNQLDMGVTIPFLLGVFEYRENNNIEIDELVEILSNIEIYIFRRLISGVPTNALNKVFTTLHNDVLKYIDECDSYVEIMKYLLITKASSARLPKDTEFLAAIEEKDVYSMRAKNKYYLFDRLENQDSVEHTNVVELMSDGTYSIEHIMPQTLSETWKAELGENYQEIYDTWINRLANLTLTGYNSKYSNRPFSEKKTIENGFEESHLQMNKFVAGCEQWTEKELKDRCEQQKELALKLWPYPTTSFEPEVQVNEKHNLDEMVDLTGKVLVSFEFMGTPYSTDAWVDMYVKVVKFLYELDATKLYRLVELDEGLGAHFISKEENGFTQIADGAFLYTATSTMSKINNLRKVFDFFEIDQSELTFEVQDNTSSYIVVPPDLKLKYWTYALPIIREAHGGTNCPYSSVNPSASNYKDGFFGVGKIHLFCRIPGNTKTAIAGLWIDCGDWDTNKKVFDLLYSHKDEIESKISMPIVWDRKETRASSIEVHLDNVLLMNESQWEEFATFHAKMTKELADYIFYPYKDEIESV